ncbi:hypothetical protein ACFVHW_01020 [Streptomyces sp. NPDC127110]|uniref:hypothetical protein n=1 Tax=Streptomyces sp. NPDC127110 TaxID=3345362 RepID=UPI00363AA6E3
MSAHPASPNTVLANALTYAEDVLPPRIRSQTPERVVFTVGTQINGTPHIGTSLVQALTFAVAARVHVRFGLPVSVAFGALDNAPHEVVTDPVSGHRYQRAYAQAIGEEEIRRQVDVLYGPLFKALSALTGVSYGIETYSEQQRGESFRCTWLRVLPRVDAARWWLAPPTASRTSGCPAWRPDAAGRRSTPSAPACTWKAPTAR